jgi:hypothetical protein
LLSLFTFAFSDRLSAACQSGWRSNTFQCFAGIRFSSVRKKIVKISTLPHANRDRDCIQDNPLSY